MRQLIMFGLGVGLASSFLVAPASAAPSLNGCAAGPVSNQSTSCDFVGEPGNYRVQYAITGSGGPWVVAMSITCAGFTTQFANANPATIHGVPGGYCTFNVGVAGFTPFRVAGTATLV